MEKSHQSSEVASIEIEYAEKFEKSKGYYIVKRIIDVTGSLFGLAILSPLMLTVAVVVKLESKGPIFFGQERVGKGGKIFKMYKFRSMVTNAEEILKDLEDKNEMSGPMFKMRNDPRITRVGKFIRKTSLDELPQLFNILKNDMSIVGPRPNFEKEVIQFNAFQKQKLHAKPGLTCYWQVMGRSSVGFEEWMDLDVRYLEERSTWVDIKLIFRTFRVLFGDDNAV